MQALDNSNEKHLIVQAIKTHKLEEVEKILDFLGQNFSVKQMGRLLFEAISELSAEDKAWAHDYLLPPDTLEEMQHEMAIALYQLLIDKGLQVGRDFSTHEAGLTMTRRASEMILADLPRSFGDTFDELLASGVISIAEVSPVEVLEQELQVPFVENLLQLIEQRLPNLTDEQACTYLYHIFEGVEARTGISMVDFVSLRLRGDERLGKLYQMMAEGVAEENTDWMFDLVAAAAGEEKIELDPQELRILNRPALELLHKVYLGDRPVASLIEAVEYLQQAD